MTNSLLQIFLLLLIIIGLAIGVNYNSKSIVSNLWILMFLSALLGILKSTAVADILRDFKNKFVSKINLKNSLTERKIIAVIILVVFVAGFYKSYYLGGDDTRLFYLYPREYLMNFARYVTPSNAVSEMVSFLPARSIFYFSLMLTMLKTMFPFLNLQSSLYAANIFFGLFFFYKLISYTVKDKINLQDVKYKEWILFICSFIYVFSMFNIYILYNARLIAIYTVSIFPLSILLFVKSVRENKPQYIFLISLIWSVFCMVSAASLWFVASVIIASPIIIFLCWGKLVGVIKYLSLLALLLFLINLHWLYYLPYTTLFNKAGISQNNVTSETFLESSAQGLMLNSEINEVFYPLNNLFHFQIQDNFKWPYFSVTQNWYLKIIPLTSIFILTIIWAAIIKSNNKVGRMFKVSLFSLLLGIFFYTIDLGNTKLGNWGISFFIFLIEKIPGFVAFRNTYDKFAHALSFSYAFCLAVSLLLVGSKMPSRYIKLCLGTLSLASFLIALPFLSMQINKLPIWKTSSSYYTTTQINSDYLNLVSFIRNNSEVGRYLTLPVTAGNIAFIQDEKAPNHYYVGVSPLLILSGKNDFSGGLSFGHYSNEFMASLYKKDYRSFGKILQMTNTKYVIVNNTITDDLKNSYLLRDGIYEAQTKEFLDIIVGEKIASFGRRYDLYKINHNFESSKIFVTEGNRNNSVKFSKKSEYEYEIDLTDITSGEQMVYLDPYFSGWDLYQLEGGRLAGDNSIYDKWANSWIINHPGEYKLIFTPSQYLVYLEIISFCTVFLSVVFIGVKFRKSR